MTMTRLILLRHGATEANLRRPYTLQGLRPDSELVAVGITQAEAVREALRSFPITHIYTSPLLRARHTAEIVNQAFSLSLREVPELVEIDIGIWSGLTWDEIEKRWPKEHLAFCDDPDRHPYLGGETYADVRRRAVPAIEAIVYRHPGEMILVVCHGVVNRILLAHWMNLPADCARHIPHDNTGYNHIEFSPDKVRVRTINEASHLLTLTR